jgi:hypothetical protein
MLSLEQLSWCYSQNRIRQIEAEYQSQNAKRIGILDDRQTLSENIPYALPINLEWDKLPACEIVSPGAPVLYPPTTFTSEICSYRPERLFWEQSKKR